MRIIFVTLLLSLCAYGQEFRATLAGRITDTAGSRSRGR